MTFARILVALDATPQSAAALKLATRLAADQSASLTITTVVGRPGDIYAPPEVVVDPSTEERITRDAEALLDRAADDARKAGVSVSTCVREGNVIDSILACIADQQADLIVLGTHGRKGVARVLQGSVAEGVMRGTTIPVLVAHATVT